MDQIIRHADGTINVDATIAQSEADRHQRRQTHLAEWEARWEASPAARRHAAWRAGWERRLRILKIATAIFAAQLVVWFVLAWNGFDDAARIVFFSQFVTAIVPVYITAWSWKEFLK